MSRGGGACRRCCRALLADVAASSAQLPVLRRVLAIIEAIGQRSAYFALLQENVAARARGWSSCAGTAISSPRRSPPIRCCSMS